VQMVVNLLFPCLSGEEFPKDNKAFWDMMLCRWTSSFPRFERSVVTSCSGSDSASRLDECW